MPAGREGYRGRIERDRKERRRRLGLAAGVLAVLFCFTLCLRTTCLGLIPPRQELVNLYTMFRIFFSDVFHTSFAMDRKAVMASCPLYQETAGRFASTVLTVAAGGVLSLSGAVYQSIFHNPLAVPSMLGVSGAVNTGMLILVLLYSDQAMMMAARGEIITVITAFAVLAAVILYGRFLGGRVFSVVEMLIAGSILARILSQVFTLVQRYMTNDDLLTLQNLQLYGYGLTREGNAAAFFVPVLAALIPLLLIRFSMNAVAFSADEARCMGFNTFRLSLLSLICGTLLVVVAVLFCGDIGMLALMIPFLCRALFGADFRNQLVSCLIFGAGFLLVCRIIAVCCSFHHGTQFFTLGTIVSLLTAPFFMFVIARGRRGWN